MTPPRMTVLAEGAFGVETSKTASSAVRYCPERVSSVIDSRFAGKTTDEVVGFGGDIPMLASFDEALARDDTLEALLIGIAPQGGALPPQWREVLHKALDAGLDILSGLHQHLSDDPDLAARAEANGCRLVDFRKPPPDLIVGAGRAQQTRGMRVLTVGTDCNTGKMTVSIELQRGLADMGISASFAATGQTGILLAGSGIAVDAVVSDFISGAAEKLTLDADDGSDVILVEGQGSLMHPGFSGVTLGLLHGSMPHAMILTWMPSRKTVFGANHTWVKIPELDIVLERYEEALAWAQPDVHAKVIAVAVATYDLSEQEALESIEHAQRVTGLPAADPIRFGVEPLAEAVQARLEQYRAEGT